MDLMLNFLFFIISISCASSYHESTIEDFYDYTSEDVSKLTKPPQKTKPRTERPLANYEVTETVEDIPNPNLNSNRIVTNFTVNKPLNIVPIQNRTENFAENLPNDVVNEENGLVYKDDSLFNPESNEEDTEDVSFENSPNIPDFNLNDNEHDSHEDFDHVPSILPTLAAYLHGLKNGIISGLNGLVGKVYKGGKVNEPSRRSTPVWLVNKLRNRQGHGVKHEHTHFDDEFGDY